MKWFYLLIAAVFILGLVLAFSIGVDVGQNNLLCKPPVQTEQVAEHFRTICANGVIK